MSTEQPLRIAVIGAGRWGPNHVRNFHEIGATVVGVADLEQSRLAALRQRYPGLVVSTDYRDFLARDDVDAVVVATPVTTHARIVADALAAGKDVLAEKPLAATTAECVELADVARAHGRLLMTGHVFLFNSGILKLKELLQYGELGDVYYFHITRTNLGPIRQDTNAVGDLASHDIATLNFLIGASPTHVSGTGMSYLQEGREDVAFVTLFYPNRTIASLHISWLDPMKVRRITAVGSKKMAIWDDLSQQGPVAIYSKRIVREPVDPSMPDYGDFQLLVREGEINIPLVHQIEPLRAQAQYFIQAVRQRALRVCDAPFATEVVRIVECINESIVQGGSRVAVS
ncbi:MAG TPA: Gfo/Idh/MocA family oxidoreductase [Candidatus Binatia bacterium]|jgi:predicted dehydrogenase